MLRLLHLSHPLSLKLAAVLLQEFANGYKIGEVLAACNLQPDFDKFVPNSKPDSLINNFTRLQVSLARLLRRSTSCARQTQADAWRWLWLPSCARRTNTGGGGDKPTSASSRMGSTLAGSGWTA